MNNRLILAFFLQSSFSFLVAQNATLDKKRDYQWPFGYYYYQNGNLMDFNTKPVMIKDFPNRMKEGFNEYNSAICSTSGQLEFSTNGCDVYNKKFQVMKNGDKINPGVYTEGLFCRNEFSVRIRNGSLILPYQNRYLMLHTTYDVNIQDPNARLYVPRLSYSIVDMKKDTGYGEVIVKNKTIIQDTLSAGDIAACRHANGKDWWVIVPQWTWDTTDSTDNNKYYRLLVTQDTILGPWEQQIGMKPNKRRFNEQVCFSPDGTKYARLRSRDGLMLFEFDRLTGLFSKPKVVTLKRTGYRGGVCFSSDSRYLYALMDSVIYQIDTSVPDPNQAKEVIAVFDGFTLDGLWLSTFDGAYLGPDCKIYIVPQSNNEYLTVINYPNRKGLASGVEQHGLKVPTKIDWSVPNYPHFRLGAIGEEHTPCDSTISPYISAVSSPDEVPVSVAIYPNPAQDHVNLDIFGYVNRFEKGNFELFDLSGRIVAQFPIYQGHDQYDFDISGILNGVYIWRLTFDGTPGGKSGKLVVMTSR
ncbi:MAG: T9SS type A sorting domain-containing protein [Saprospiraceae bacterium]